MNMNEEHYSEVKTEDYLYKIGMFAQMNHITVKTLRFYEEQGLLSPAHIDEESGYRYYKMSQMEVVHRILALKEAGFKIEDIKQLNCVQDESSFILQKKNEILAKIADLTLQLSKLDCYFNGGPMTLASPIRIKTIPKVRCVAVQTRIESYDKLFEAMPQMGEMMEEAGCECLIPEYCFTNYLEPGYKEENVLIETCEAISKMEKPVEGLIDKEYPEIEAACVYHKGSYANFHRTYAAVLKYIEENHLEISGPIRECYIDGVWNKDTEEEWLSEIQIPVRKKERE